MTDTTPGLIATIQIRAYPVDVPRLDAVIESLRTEQPKATRADALRFLLNQNEDIQVRRGEE